MMKLYMKMNTYIELFYDIGGARMTFLLANNNSNNIGLKNKRAK